GEDVVARRVVDDDRRVAHDGREVLKGDREDLLAAANADRAEVALTVASHNAVDVLPALDRIGEVRVRRWDRHVGHSSVARGRDFASNMILVTEKQKQSWPRAL